MFFLDQPEILTKTAELDELLTAFRGETCKSVDIPFDQYEMNDYHTYGASSRVRNDASKIFSYKQDDWDLLFKTVDALAPALESFVEALENYADDYHALTDADDKKDQISQFAQALTNVIIPTSLQPTILETNLKYREWAVSDVSKAQIPLLIPRYLNLLHTAFKGSLVLINDYNYKGKEFSTWFIALLYKDLARKSYLSSYIEKPPTPHPSILLGGQAESPTAYEAEVYAAFFQHVIQDDVAMLYFARDHGLAYLYQWLLLWIDYVNEHNLQSDQDLRLNVLFPGLNLIMEVIDHIILTCSHVATTFHQQVFHLVGLVTWWISFLSVHEAKVSGAHERYDLYAARLAQYHYWLVNYAIHSRYRAVSTGYYSSHVKKYQLFERQAVLHKNSVKYITPTYNLACELLGKERGTTDLVLVEPSKIRPVLNVILSLPTEKELGQDFKTLATMDDQVTSREYFDPKIERILNNPDDAVSVFTEEDRDKQVVGPLEFFTHENKKDVDPQSVFGKIRYVNGALYDYRVKVVNANPDLVVKALKSSQMATKAGEWKSVNANEDYKIKIVKSGTHDFTIQYK